jgi:hypothetical protein
MFGFFWYRQEDEHLDINSAYIYTFKESGVPIYDVIPIGMWATPKCDKWLAINNSFCVRC